MMMHELKIWPENYEPLVLGAKRYEIRKADRPFKVGDQLMVREWLPDMKKYTGRSAIFRITHMTEPGKWGLPDDICVLSLA
jgi:hypothetical protein